MNVDLTHALTPLYDAVHAAQTHLDEMNRAPVHPLQSLPAAGRVIRTQGELIRALEQVLEPVKAECGCEENMRVQGRLRALAEEHQHT